MWVGVKDPCAVIVCFAKPHRDVLWGVLVSVSLSSLQRILNELELSVCGLHSTEVVSQLFACINLFSFLCAVGDGVAD